MKTKQEQIEEIAKVIHKVYITRICKDEYTLAEEIYKAGYRKASDVIEEVISSVKSIIKTAQMCKDVFLSVENYEWLWNRLTELAAKMRQEVEK